MNILQIVPQIPYPLDSGARIGIFNITKHLSLRGHSIIMVALVNETFVKHRELEEYCDLILIHKDTRNHIIGMLGNLFSKVPYTISKYYSLYVLQRLKEIVKNTKIDIIHVDHLHMALYGKLLEEEFKIPITLRQHNVEHVIWERFYQTRNNPIIKLYSYLQFKKVKIFEKELCKCFDSVFAITRNDQERIKKLDPSIKVLTIPAGVDKTYYYPLNILEEKGTIIFVGSLDWIANDDGILWFVRNVFPLICDKYSQVKFNIVGKNPSKQVMALRNSNINVYPNVPDVRDYIAKSEVFIVPLRIGGGMRLKILEALAMKKAVVSTSIGCEGIDIKDKKDLLIADTEKEFAQNVIFLLENKHCQEKLRSHGYNTVLKKYSWGNVVENIEHEYQSVILEYKERIKS